MKHLIWLVVILGVSANAETFRMVWDKNGITHDLVCFKEKVLGEPQFGYEHYSCKSDDTWDNVVFTATLEVSCSSENITITVPFGTPMSLRSRQSLYIVDGRSMGRSEIGQRFDHDYANGTTYVRGKSFIQKFPVDVYFYDGSKFLTQGGCGGQRMENSASSQCSKVVTSGPLRWSKYLREGNDPPPVATFSISRRFLWQVLKNRQGISDCHDRGEGCGFETEYIKMLLWRVDYPNVKLIALGDRVGRRERRTTQSYPLVFSMFGRARAWDGFSPPKDTRIPDVAYEELNRLQDYYNSCQVPQAAPPPPPAPERPALDYSAINAKESISRS